ncbi:MAG: hypothetical protein Q9162_000034, partial [Coniocarpon cinnabarinum]
HEQNIVLKFELSLPGISKSCLVLSSGDFITYFPSSPYLSTFYTPIPRLRGSLLHPLNSDQLSMSTSTVPYDEETQLLSSRSASEMLTLYTKIHKYFTNLIEFYLHEDNVEGPLFWDYSDALGLARVALIPSQSEWSKYECSANTNSHIKHLEAESKRQKVIASPVIDVAKAAMNELWSWCGIHGVNKSITRLAWDFETFQMRVEEDVLENARSRDEQLREEELDEEESDDDEET